MKTYKPSKSGSLIALYAIGDTGPAGGKVLYCADRGLHGMEVAPADQISAPWGCDGITLNGADGTAVGTGAKNTMDILAGSTNTGIAASNAATYELNGFDDWFLPSKDELDLLYLEKAVVGIFADPYYWSSTEYNSGLAWFQSFSNVASTTSISGPTRSECVLFGPFNPLTIILAMALYYEAGANATNFFRSSVYITKL